MDSDGNLLERINREAYGFGVTNKTLAMPIVNKQKAIHLASCTTRWNFTYSTSQPIPYLGASTVVRLTSFVDIMLRAHDPLYVGSELGRTWSRLEGNERSHPYHPYRLE